MGVKAQPKGQPGACGLGGLGRQGGLPGGEGWVPRGMEHPQADGTPTRGLRSDTRPQGKGTQHNSGQTQQNCSSLGSARPGLHPPPPRSWPWLPLLPHPAPPRASGQCCSGPTCSGQGRRRGWIPVFSFCPTSSEGVQPRPPPSLGPPCSSPSAAGPLLGKDQAAGALRPSYTHTHMWTQRHTQTQTHRRTPTFTDTL